MPGEIGEPPEDLDEDAAIEWRRVVPDLESVGVGTNIDRELLANYCRAIALGKMAEKEIRAKGILVEGKFGPVKNPAITAATQFFGMARMYASEFGITPASRTKVKGTKPAEKASKFGKFAQKTA